MFPEKEWRCRKRSGDAGKAVFWPEMEMETSSEARPEKETLKINKKQGFSVSVSGSSNEQDENEEVFTKSPMVFFI